MVHEGNTNVIALKMHVWLILLIVVYPEVLWARRRHLNMHGEDMHMQAPFVPFETVLLPNNRSIGSYKSAKVSSISYTLPDSIRITASITTGSIGDVENPILLLGGQSTDQMDSGCGSWYLWSRNSNVNFGIMCYGPPKMITSGSVLKPNKNYVIVATYNKTHATLDINDYVLVHLKNHLVSQRLGTITKLVVNIIGHRKQHLILGKYIILKLKIILYF